MDEAHPYHASIEIKESGTNQKPAIHASITTGTQTDDLDFASHLLTRYMAVVRALRPDDLNAKAYFKVMAEFKEDK